MKKVLAIASLALFFDVAAIGQQPLRVVQGMAAAQSILDVLAAARVAASLTYTGKCGPHVLVPDLPSVREPEKPYAQNPADTFRSMFSVDGRTVVSQENNGIIRVIETGVQTDILHVRIAHLSFKGISDPDEALHVVLSAAEVQSFMQANGIRQPFYSYSVPFYLLPGPNKTPMPGSRSISGELDEVTLADALDYIVKAFAGFWLYQNCQSLNGQRLVYFDLFPSPGRMWPWEDGNTLVK